MSTDENKEIPQHVQDALDNVLNQFKAIEDYVDTYHILNEDGDMLDSLLQDAIRLREQLEKRKQWEQRLDELAAKIEAYRTELIRLGAKLTRVKGALEHPILNDSERRTLALSHLTDWESLT